MKTRQNQIKIEEQDIESLIPYAKNSRIHSSAQVKQIAASITEFGFTNPVLIDGENGIIAGHGRVMAAQLLGLKMVPVIRLDHLTDAQKRAYVIADNKLSDNSDFDERILAEELMALESEGYDLEVTGFSDQELDDLLAQILDVEEEPEVDEQAGESAAPERAVTVRGDVWHLGRHRLVCGQPDVMDDVTKIANGKSFDFVIIDAEHITKKSEENSEKMELMISNSVMSMDNNSVFASFANEEILPIIEESIESHLENIENHFYQNSAKEKRQYSRIAVSPFVIATKGSAYHPLELPKNLWECGESQRSSELTRAILEKYTSSKATAVNVLGLSDPRGVTVLACDVLKMTAHVIEGSPKNCDRTIRLWQQRTGKKAMHAESKAFFCDLEG